MTYFDNDYYYNCAGDPCVFVGFISMRADIDLFEIRHIRCVPAGLSARCYIKHSFTGESVIVRTTDQSDSF